MRISSLQRQQSCGPVDVAPLALNAPATCCVVPPPSCRPVSKSGCGHSLLRHAFGHRGSQVRMREHSTRSDDWGESQVLYPDLEQLAQNGSSSFLQSPNQDKFDLHQEEGMAPRLMLAQNPVARYGSSSARDRLQHAIDMQSRGCDRGISLWCRTLSPRHSFCARNTHVPRRMQRSATLRQAFSPFTKSASA